MVARGTKRFQRLPAAMLVVIAGGLAGCTSGPAVKTAGQDPAAEAPVILKTQRQSETSPVAVADKPTLAERMRTIFKRPQWVDNLRFETFQLDTLVPKDQLAPPDPFVVARAEAKRETEDAFVDYTPVYIQPVSYETAAADADPSTPRSNSHAEPTTGVSGGNRPANPFLRSDASAAFPPRPVASLAASLEKPDAGPARSDHRTQSVTNYLADPHNEQPGVLHSDMIVDTCLDRSRDDKPVEFVAAEVAPQEPHTTRKKVIEPASPPMRQPFGDTNWSNTQAAPAVSANVPKSVMPEVPPSAERPGFQGVSGSGEPAFSGSELFVPVDEQPQQSPADPFGDIEGKSQNQIESSATDANRHAAGKIVARSHSVEAPRPEPPVHVAVVASDVHPSHGLDLATAKHLAASQANTPPSPKIGSKVAVGLGLAAIIAGAVMIRGRLA